MAERDADGPLLPGMRYWFDAAHAVLFVTLHKIEDLDCYEKYDELTCQGWLDKCNEIMSARKDKKMPPAPTTTAPPAAAPALPGKIDVAVAQYVKLRDSLKVADDVHSEKTKKAREYLAGLNNHLLGLLGASGADSATTPAGTVYRTTKKSATIADADSFRNHIIENEAWDLADWKANPKATEAYIEELGVAPPGVNYSTTFVVGVRRK